MLIISLISTAECQKKHTCANSCCCVPLNGHRSLHCGSMRPALTTEVFLGVLHTILLNVLNVTFVLSFHLSPFGYSKIIIIKHFMGNFANINAIYNQDNKMQKKKVQTANC